MCGSAQACEFRHATKQESWLAIVNYAFLCFLQPPHPGPGVPIVSGLWTLWALGARGPCHLKREADAKIDVAASPLQCVLMPNGKAPEDSSASVDGRNLA